MMTQGWRSTPQRDPTPSAIPVPSATNDNGMPNVRLNTFRIS
jgi:hypothetical protein